MTLIKSIKWSVISTIITQAIIFFTITSLSHVLNVKDYAYLITLQTLILSLSIFASGGIGATATRYIALYHKKKLLKLNNVITLTIIIVLTLSLLMTLILIFNDEKISSLIFNEVNNSDLVLIVSLALFFIVNDGLLKAILIGYKYTEEFAKSSIIGILPYLPLLYFLSYSYGIYGSVIGLCLSYFFQLIVSAIFCIQVLKKENYKFSTQEICSQLSIIIKFSIPAFISGVLVMPANSIVQSLIIRIDDGLFELAILGIAMQWFNVLQIFPTTISRVLLPFITNKLSDNRSQDFIKSVLIMVLLLLCVSIIIIIIFSFFSSYIYMLYNPVYYEKLDIIFIALFAGLFKAISAPFAQAILSKGRVWFAVVLNACWITLFLVIAYINIQSGATGIIYSFLITYILMFLITIIWFFTDKSKVVL